MNQLLFRCLLTALLAWLLVGCASGPSPSAPENKRLISSTAEAIPPAKGVPGAQPKPTPPPKPKKVRVVSQPKRRLGPEETEQFTKKALDLLAPFQASDIATKDLGGAIISNLSIAIGGHIIGTASKTRDDGTTVTLKSLTEEQAVQPKQVIVYHKAGNISPIDLNKGNIGKRMLAFMAPNTDAKSNRLRFSVVIIYEEDGDVEHQYVYLMGMGVWSYEVFKYDLPK